MFQFDPATGLLDETRYPKVPANGAAARQQFMDMLNQIKNYMNDSLSTTESLAENGYMKYPNGLIEQWGRITISVSANVPSNFNITFPTPFNAACYNIQYSISSLSSSIAEAKVWGNNQPSKTGVTNSSVVCAATNTIYIDYRAIGK